MHNSIKQCALAGCASIMVAGCATQQSIGPEYRVTSSAAVSTDGVSLIERGRAQLDAGLSALAIESFRGEIRVNPESADAYNGLAVAYGRIGRRDLAQRYFETALAKDPSNIRAQTNLAKLIGNPAPMVDVADATIPSPPVGEPVSVTSVVDTLQIGDVVAKLEIPVSAVADLSGPVSAEVQHSEVLARQGVLSNRFSLATARSAITRIAQLPTVPPEPPRLPEPVLPLTGLPIEFRTNGARLERVSLGEVRLITQPDPPAKHANRKSEFATFGDRLATWLPQSMAIEQAASYQLPTKSIVIMAAIERAEEQSKQSALLKTAVTPLPDFAYLFFETADDVAKA